MSPPTPESFETADHLRTTLSLRKFLLLVVLSGDELSNGERRSCTCFPNCMLRPLFFDAMSSVRAAKLLTLVVNWSSLMCTDANEFKFSKSDEERMCATAGCLLLRWCMWLERSKGDKGEFARQSKT